MPAISVIIPTYNRAHLIAEAIRSVLNQTFTDFEVIVVDDGSTDNTEEVLRSFVDSRLNYLKRLHEGPSEARNAGLEAATGKFIAFLDSDDLFLPEKLSLQMSRVDANPEVGLVYGLYRSRVGSEGSIKTVGVCYPELGLRRLILGPAFHWSTVLIRRTLLEQVGGFDKTFTRGQDWELTLRLALAGCQMVGIAEPVSFVRVQPISNTRDQLPYIAGLLAILDKTFSDPRMPSDLMNMKALAHASQLLRIAASAYVTSHLETGHELVQRALAACPDLMNEQTDFLVELLVYRIRGLSVTDPEEILKQVLQDLPVDRSFARKLKPRLWGKYYEIAAFHAYQSGQRAKCVASAIRAVFYTPSRIRNRGLLSIFIRSLVGNQADNDFRTLSTVERES